VFKPLEKVDFPESAKMMIRIEPVKPKGLLKLAEELEKKQVYFGEVTLHQKQVRRFCAAKITLFLCSSFLF